MSGNIVAQYKYDAWGKMLAVLDGAGVDVSGDAGHIANVNPLRYRGYYWDSCSGFYYLQSRYYDPQIGRFINADAQINEGILGTNLFAYCENNPVNFIDRTGHFGTPIQWACAVIGGIAGWYFGDFVARKIGLFPGNCFQW